MLIIGGIIQFGESFSGDRTASTRSSGRRKVRSDATRLFGHRARTVSGRRSLRSEARWASRGSREPRPSRCQRTARSSGGTADPVSTTSVPGVNCPARTTSTRLVADQDRRSGSDLLSVCARRRRPEFNRTLPNGADSVSDRRRGQVLPLFALMLIAFFAIASLAVDVSSGYSARQAYRTASDAASLAGAQNLQTGGVRAVTATDRTNARTDALGSLVQAFNATGTGSGACDPTAQVINCALAGTPFRVSIKTPSPSCVLCGSGDHAVQVTVGNPNFQLSFARAVGIDHWNVATTSVAGLEFGGAYAVITLRPPKPNATSDSNASNHAQRVRYDTQGGRWGHRLEHQRPPQSGNHRTRSQLLPVVLRYRRWLVRRACRETPELDDSGPHYPVTTIATGSTPAGSVDTDPETCSAALASVNASGYVSPGSPPWTLPEPRATSPASTRSTCIEPNAKLTILEPGVYFLNQGLDLKGEIVGGYSGA